MVLSELCKYVGRNVFLFILGEIRTCIITYTHAYTTQSKVGGSTYCMMCTTISVILQMYTCNTIVPYTMTCGTKTFLYSHTPHTHITHTHHTTHTHITHTHSHHTHYTAHSHHTLHRTLTSHTSHHIHSSQISMLTSHTAHTTHSHEHTYTFYTLA